MAPALCGRTIVVTRPAAQAAGLIAGIEAAGGRALGFPLLDIEAADPSTVVAAATPWLDSSVIAIFVSPNAVRHGATPLHGRWPPALVVAAVGQGTARGLAGAGFANVVAPATGSDSEALLAHPALAAERVRGRDVLLFKGEGGRPLLAEALAARGAQVRPVVCYRRLPPAAPPAVLFGLADRGVLDAIVVTSSEALGHLDALFGGERAERLRDLLVVATHARIADAATRLGCRRVLVTEPGDAPVLAALASYNWPPAPMPAP